MRPTLTGALKSIRGLMHLGDDDFEPLFVCGIAGCGNTLLAALLHERYRVGAFADESALRAPFGSPFFLESTVKFASLAQFTDALQIPAEIDQATLRRSLARQYCRESPLPKLGRVVIDKAPNAHLLRSRQLHAAYPEGHFVLVFREPASHIEGLRRKWTLFRNAPLEKLCDFWIILHERFMAESADFRDLVTGISYETLVANTDEVCERVAQWACLEPRAVNLKRQDSENRPGFALRNVRIGQIAIVKDVNRGAISKFTQQELDVIRTKLTPLYEKMRAEFAQRHG